MNYTVILTRLFRSKLFLWAIAVTAILILQADSAHAATAISEPDLLETHHISAIQEFKASSPEANLPYLFAVYILTWAGFFGYVFFMSRRQKGIQKDIKDLKSITHKNDKPTANSS